MCIIEYYKLRNLKMLQQTSHYTCNSSLMNPSYTSYVINHPALYIWAYPHQHIHIQYVHIHVTYVKAGVYEPHAVQLRKSNNSLKIKFSLYFQHIRIHIISVFLSLYNGFVNCMITAKGFILYLMYKTPSIMQCTIIHYEQICKPLEIAAVPAVTPL